MTRLPSTVLGVLKSQCIRRDCLGRVRHGLGDNDLLGSTFGSMSRFKCWLLGYPRDLWDLWLHYFLVSKSKNSSQFSPQDLWLSNFGSTSSALGQKGDHNVGWSNYPSNPYHNWEMFFWWSLLWWAPASCTHLKFPVEQDEQSTFVYLNGSQPSYSAAMVSSAWLFDP